MKRILRNITSIFIMLALAFLLLSPGIAAQDNIVSVSHSPEYPFPGEAIAVSMVVNDSSNITNIRLLYCQIEPLYLCYTPSLNMSYIGSNTYTVSITEHLEEINRLGYNITVTYDDGSKEYSPSTGSYNYVNITGDDTTTPPCPIKSTLAIQVLIVIIVVIFVFLIIKQLGARRKQQKPNKKVMTVLVVVIILLSFVALALFLWSQGSSEVKEATNFTLTDIDGNTFNLTDYQGQVVILDMMSIPCTGCKEVEEDLQEIYPDYKDEVVFISIDILREDTNEMLRDYRDRKDIDWTVARDTDDIILKYNVDGIPKVVIIDKEGYATYEHRGETDVGTLKKQLDLAIEGKAEAVSIQEVSFISLAIFAGIASFFSPCSFPMLPGYIAYYLKKDSEAGGTIPMRKAVISGTVSAAGIIIVYVTVGIVVIFAGASVIQNIGYFMIVVGILLIILGALMFTPLQYWKIVRPFQALWARIRGLGGKKDASGTGSSTGAVQGEKGEPGFYSGLFLYGLGYGAAASGCTAPLFIAVMSLAIVSGLFMGILILVLYTSAAALLMIGVTVTIAYFGAGAAQKLSKYTEVIKKISGAVLVAVGIFLIWMFISTL